jgi:peptidoglycan hydrolase-like protein with peptidoglycan-binding domain
MKTFLSFLFLAAVTVAAWADDLTRAVQQRLKDQGFFYGSVNGQGGSETSAAIRRYQIRYGLRVTGELNDETLRSLGVSKNNVAPSEPTYRDNRGPSPNRPDQGYLPQPPNSPDQGYLPQPGEPSDERDYRFQQPRAYAQPNFDSSSYSSLFAQTPYEQAPDRLQANVLFAVQGELARRGYYRGELDGQPGPATFDAILHFQQNEGLRPSGRLDVETLNELRALPGQPNGPPERGFGYPGPDRRRVYRGIWVR